MKQFISLLLFAIICINCKSQHETINVRFEIKNEWEKSALTNASLKIFNINDKILISRTKEDSLPIVVKLIRGQSYKLKASAKCHLVKKIDLQIPNEIADEEFVVLIDLKKFTDCQFTMMYHNLEINFKKDDFKLTRIEEAILDSIGLFIIQNPEIALHVYGHTDHQEDPKIADKRIYRVKDYLIKNGVSIKQIKTKNMGVKHPLISLAEINRFGTEEEKKAAFHLNRRLSFDIYHLDEKLK